jgi:hypothetical protein
MLMTEDAGPAQVNAVWGKNINHFGLQCLMDKCKQLLN